MYNLYAVKTFHVQSNPDSIYDWTGSTDAIFDNFTDALRCIEHNALDLSDDGYNQYALICPFELGLYPILETEDQLWFEWWDDRYHAIPIRPEVFGPWALTI